MNLIAQPIKASTVNIHELANAPGFGCAAETLRRAGMWNEGAIAMPRRWRVILSGSETVTYECTVTVEADTEEEAHRLARDKVDGSSRLWESCGGDGVEIDGIATLNAVPL